MRPAWNGASVTPLWTESRKAGAPSASDLYTGTPSGVMMRSAPHDRTMRALASNGKAVTARRAVSRRTGRVVPSSLPTSSEDSPKMQPPSIVWRMKLVP